MPTLSREIHLQSRPDGLPEVSDFIVVEVEVPDPGEGEVLVQNIYMSVDPYMRARMREAWGPGKVLEGGAIGKVIQSNHPKFSEGEYVSHGLGWREYFISNGEGLNPVDPELAPLSTYLGVMGMPGLTAYGGLLVTGELKDGETVFVSAAAGAVGSLVGQIAKIKGCTVIGSAGSDDKVSQLTNDYGFDHAFNYKTADALAELKKGAPKGIDVYFENVGGPQLEAALTCMRPYGRISVCGMIAHYNDTSDNMTPGPRNLTEIIYKHVMIRGFVVSAFGAHQPQFLKDMSEWIKNGKVKYKETVFDGIEKAPEAFAGLFSGANEGKMLVKLADA